MGIKINLKKVVLLLFVNAMCIYAYGQEKDSTSKVIWMRNTSFYFVNSFYFGDNMVADSHRLHNMGAEVKLGIVRYKNVGLTLFTGFTRLKVNDTQMIGNVKNSRQIKGGASVFYQVDVTEKSTVKPEIGIYDTSFASSGPGVKIKSMSGTGLLIGADYQYKVEKGFRAVVGLHYHWNNYNVRTAPEYKNYFEQAKYIQLSVGFNF